MRRLALIALLALVMLPTPAEAVAKSVKFACKTAGVATLDPIVVPDGGPSAHEHVFTGNVGVPKGVHTYDEAILQQTTCTFTIDGVRVDTAAYWVPAMYDPMGNLVPVKFVAYYDKMQAPVTAFPPDMGLIWGPGKNGLFSSKQRSYGGFNCDNSEPLQRSFANVDCRGMASNNVVTFRAFSPYCWTGETAATRDHSNEVVYPVNYPTNQLCPAGYVTLPRLRVNANYQTQYNPMGRLSSDAPGQHGESAHTDFWNTWQQPALEALVAQLNA